MKSLKSIILIIVAILGLWLGGRWNAALLNVRRDPASSETPGGAEPDTMVTFTTIVLGGFRGLLADILWLRASRLQEEGRFFELVQLADWITALEPESTEVWGFHAWNLAYNVSAIMADEEERWRWVMNGISLLRDEGLRNNPADSRLYFELGWLYQHKVGYTADAANAYYKIALARQVENVLPGGRLDPSDLSSSGSELAGSLKQELGLDLNRMRKMDERYGPLDWRLPESHAIYWASLGLDCAPDGKQYLCERMITQCVAVSALSGSLDFDLEQRRYERSPAPVLLPKAISAYETARARYADRATLNASFTGFLERAVLVADSLGLTETAADLRNRLIDVYGEETR